MAPERLETRCTPTLIAPVAIKAESLLHRVPVVLQHASLERLLVTRSIGQATREDAPKEGGERFPSERPLRPERGGICRPLSQCRADVGSALELKRVANAPIPSRPAVRTTLLAIPPRQQWDENGGYCGETSIQSVALSFGTYASQYRIRAFINPDQQAQLLIGVNEQIALRALRLTFDQWNFNQPTPQAKNYLAWVKQKIQAGAPVIGTLYIRGMADPDYDHIVAMIGFRSSRDSKAYHPGDVLLFNDHFATAPLSRTFATLAATRRNANARSFLYAIPRRIDYGCAVTGIVDTLHETVPVRLQVDRSWEPDLIAGAQPVIMHATMSVQSLVPGKTYSLLRYDDPAVVPDSGFLANGGYAWARTFTATAATQTFTDQFLSNAVVTYRCVPS